MQSSERRSHLLGHERRAASRHASPSLLQSFVTQLRVIYALIMREIHTRYGRENIGFLWVIGEPILFCAGVAIVWTAMRPSHENGLKMTAMVVTGYVPLTLWRHAMGRAIKAYAVNSSLLFHRLVTPLDIIIARTTLEVVGTVLAGSLVLGGSIFLNYMDPPDDWGKVYLGLAFVIYFSYDTALIISALTERSELLEKAMSIAGYLSLPLTGAFTMTEWVPAHYRWILEWSPLANAIELIRDGEFGLKVVPHYSIPFLMASCTVLFIIGLFLTLRVREHIEIL